MSAKLFKVRRVVVSLLIAGMVTAVFFRSSLRSEASDALTSFVPIIGATKSVTVVTGNADADADPGETLEYTVTINNTGPDPATGVAINDTIQSITTLVAGSTIASPIAVNDTFSSIGNVGISVPAANGVFLNDLNPNGSGTLVVQSVNQAGLQGLLSLNTTTGAFDFTPNAGFEGSTSFTYTLANGTGLTDTATVTINVTGMIWFINANLGVNGDGRLGAPFNSLANFNAGAADEPNDSIFLFESATGYSGGVTLLSGQKLIGQDATATLAAITGVTVPPFSSPALPAMNTGAPTTNFTGTTTINTNTTLRGFSVTSTTLTGINDPAGAITGVNTSEVRVATTTGTAVLLSDTGGTFSLISVSANGAANGISLTNTTGSFAVVGDGTNISVGGNGSGGTVSNATGPDGATTGNGVYLSNAQNVTLRRMTLNGTNQNYAIRGITVSNFNLEYSTVAGTNGNQPLQDEGSVRFSDLTGAAGFLNCNISGGLEDNIRIGNTSGTLNRVTVNGTTIGANSTANGNDGITIETLNSANINATIQNSIFTAAAGDLFQFNSNASSGATDDLIFNNNTLTNNHPLIATGGGGTSIFSNGQKNFTFHIEGNSFRDAVGHNVLLAKVGGTGIYSGTFSNNTIGAVGAANSGSLEGSGLKIQTIGGGVAGTGGMTVAVTGNTIREYNNDGILFQAGGGAPGDGTGFFNVTATGNIIGPLGTNVAAAQGVGIRVTSGTSPAPADTFQTCAQIGGAGALRNTLTNSGIAGTDSDYRVRQRFGTTVRLPGYVGGLRDAAAVVTFIDGNNIITAPAPGGTATVEPVLGGGYPGGAACTQPSTIALPATDKEASNIIYGFDNRLNFVNATYHSPFERGESTELGGNASVNQRANAVMRESTLPGGRVSAFSSLIDKLGEMISPTAQAQETKPAAPESGETVTKSLGTLPAGESIVVKFRATVDNGPYASGVNNITNTATISGSNFANVNSTTSSIALDAAPDLVVTKTEGGGTTQPSGTVVYTLSYSNTTATNGQNAANVVLTETVPANTTFNATASLPSVWSCANGSAAGTSCTLNIGAVNAGAAAGTANFAVNVLAALPAGVTQVSNTSSIAENPNVNGTDRNAADNTGPDTTNIIGNWLGGTSTDWFTASNWSNNVVPPAGNNVSIPNVANQPIVTTANITLNNMNLIGENVTINTGRTITVNGVTTLGANIVNGAGTLNLGTAATITRTTGQVECTMVKNFAATGLFTFPVGTTGSYSPLDVNVTAGTGQLSVKATTGTAPLAPVPLNAARTLQRYWTLSGSGITSNITFNYLNGDVPGPPNNENIWTVIRVTGGTTAVRYAAGPNVILNPGANTFTVNNLSVYSDWTAGEPLAPTASSATVSGQVFDSKGRGVYGSFVSITDADGNARQAITNPFGHYRFMDIQTGQSYVISVRDKRYTFQTRLVTVNDELTNLDFIAEP